MNSPSLKHMRTIEITDLNNSTENESIQEKLESAIVRGEYSPGERLDENRLAQKFGVSRTPIREAFKGLIATRLVVKRKNAGVFVVKHTLDEIIEMFELMATLEAFAAQKAALRATPEEVASIRAAHENCVTTAKSGDPAVYYSANQEFHEKIYKAAHNQVLLEQIESLDKRLSPYRRLITFRPHRIEESNVEHEAIVKAIEHHSSTEAAGAMGKHLDLLAEDALMLAKSTKHAN